MDGTASSSSGSSDSSAGSTITRSASCHDIWEDVPVLAYLTSKRYDPRATDSEKSRVRKRANRHEVRCGRLYRTARNGLREVPVAGERIPLAEQAHWTSGHRGEKSVLKTLREQYFWEKMASDVREVIAQCPVCNELKSKAVAAVPQKEEIGADYQELWKLPCSAGQEEISSEEGLLHRSMLDWLAGDFDDLNWEL